MDHTQGSWTKQITATEAARHFSEILDAVEVGGQSFVVSRKGRPIARIEPSPEPVAGW